MRKRGAAICGLLMLFSYLQAAGAPVVGADTIPAKSKEFPYRTALSAAMTIYGSIAIRQPVLKHVNESVFSVLRKPVRNGVLEVDNFIPLVEVAGLYGLHVAGMKMQHKLAKVAIIHAASLITANGITFAAKDWLPEWRPDSSNRLSFPSGHTATAFVTAEVIRREYNHISPWYGVAAYTMAAGTGFLRMYNRKHWLSDVLAGAGIGILSTQLAYWIVPLEIKEGRNKERRNAARVIVVPTVGKSCGVAMVVRG